MMEKTGAKLLVESLVEHGVDVVFGIPGAKVDSLYDALLDSPIRLILCRHEQNATFMAQAYGKLTHKPGVVIVTSGPGVSNLVTGLLTATTEGDPIVAIGANVQRSMKYKKSHQSSNNVDITKSATKFSVEVEDVANISEICASAFREALAPRSGAVFMSIPQDILKETTKAAVIKTNSYPVYGRAPNAHIKQAADLIKKGKKIAVLLGMEASRFENTQAILELLSHNPLAVTATFQAAGVISKELEHLFAGRIGLFKNQPGDMLLDQADVVITIGFSTVEYDPEIWNTSSKDKVLIHIDYIPADIHELYNPEIELLGNIAETVRQLSCELGGQVSKFEKLWVNPIHQDLLSIIKKGEMETTFPIHPLKFIHELKQVLDDDALVVCDVGSNYMWMSRYFLTHKPRHYLNSNGQQTLGVSLPWAIAARLVYPFKKIVSISGDGAFLFSSMELETAVRENLPIVHCVWVDQSYDMVKQQELMKYHRKNGVDFGYVDIVKYAEAFGAKGFRIENPDEIAQVLKKAMDANCPCLIEIKIDYSKNADLFKSVVSEGG